MPPAAYAPPADTPLAGTATARPRRQRGAWAAIWHLLVPPEGNRTSFSSSGYILVLVAVGIASAAYNTGSNILFIAISLILAAFLLSLLLSYLNFRRNSWSLYLPPHFRAGELAPLVVNATNGKRVIPTYSISFTFSAFHADKRERAFLESRLDPGGSGQATWRYTPAQRGRETLSLVNIESYFPFGFIRKSIDGGIRRRVLIWPGRVEYDFSPKATVRTFLQGEANRRPGGSSELINVRRYQAGDSQRMVHWKATARTRELMIRQMAEEKREGYLVFVESPASLWSDGAQFEKLCSFAASLTEDLFVDGRLLGVAINDQPLRHVQRVSDLNNFFDELALLKPVEGYKPGSDVHGPNVVSFKPGTHAHVHACIGGNEIGSA